MNQGTISYVFNFLLIKYHWQVRVMAFEFVDQVLDGHRFLVGFVYPPRQQFKSVWYSKEQLHKGVLAGRERGHGVSNISFTVSSSVAAE